MSKEPEFDLIAAHRYFSAHCFNAAWDLIEKEDRTEEEAAEMIRLSQASIWHWTQREDCTDQNMSIGYWQAARVFALVGNTKDARQCGLRCLGFSKELEPFYRGYAHEALARAAKVDGDDIKRLEHLAEAVKLCDQVTDESSQKMLKSDLDQLG